jgi:hypothetical protein
LQALVYGLCECPVSKLDLQLFALERKTISHIPPQPIFRPTLAAHLSKRLIGEYKTIVFTPFERDVTHGLEIARQLIWVEI